MTTTSKTIADELQIPLRQIESTVELLIAGNTIPFIARYRKEATDGLDEIALRAIEDALDRANALAARETTVLKTINELGLLTNELQAQIDNCRDIRTLEPVYLPFKPKRRTRATIAREQGLQPLADLLLRQEELPQSRQATLQAYVDPDRDVPDTETALQGALDIIAEQWSENARTRTWILPYGARSSSLAACRILWLNWLSPIQSRWASANTNTTSIKRSFVSVWIAWSNRASIMWEST